MSTKTYSKIMILFMILLVVAPIATAEFPSWFGPKPPPGQPPGVLCAITGCQSIGNLTLNNNSISDGYLDNIYMSNSYLRNVTIVDSTTINLTYYNITGSNITTDTIYFDSAIGENLTLSENAIINGDIYGNVIGNLTGNADSATTWDGETSQADLNVNSADYWDSLNNPSDISTGDLTDDNTFVRVDGDTMTGDLNVNGDVILTTENPGGDGLHVTHESISSASKPIASFERKFPIVNWFGESGGTGYFDYIVTDISDVSTQIGKTEFWRETSANEGGVNHLVRHGGLLSSYLKVTADDGIVINADNISNWNLTINDDTTINRDLIVNGDIGIKTNSPTRSLDVNSTASIGISEGRKEKTLNIAGNINFEYVSPPTLEQLNNITLTGSTGGSLTPGETYYYNVVYYNSDGDSTYGEYMPSLKITLNATQNSVIIDNIPTSNNPSVIGRKIYRSDENQYFLYHFYTLSNNVDTSITDTGYAVDTDDQIYRKPDETAGKIFYEGEQILSCGDFNTYVGSQSGKYITSGNSNAGFGVWAFRLLKTGSNNNGFGYSAGASTITGSNNNYFGYGAGQYHDGSYNVAMGSNALRATSPTGTKANNFNVAIGYGSTYQSVDISKTISIGYQSGYKLGEDGLAERNMLIGYYAGLNVNAGDDNILIGYYADVPVENTSNYLNIGDTITGDIDIGSVAIGSNTLSGLIDGGLNVSDLYVDTITYKSPVSQCSDEWCSVSFPKYQKTLWIEKNDDWTINDIVYENNHYTKNEFWKLVKGTKYENIAIKVNDKFTKLQNKYTCEHNGYQWNGTCYETIITTNIVSYEEAVEINNVYETIQEPYTCQGLSKELNIINTTCYKSIETKNIIDTEYFFRENCGWNETTNNYYCVSEKKAIVYN